MPDGYYLEAQVIAVSGSTALLSVAPGQGMGVGVLVAHVPALDAVSESDRIQLTRHLIEIQRGSYYIEPSLAGTVTVELIDHGRPLIAGAHEGLVDATMYPWANVALTLADREDVSHQRAADMIGTATASIYFLALLIMIAWRLQRTTALPQPESKGPPPGFLRRMWSRATRGTLGIDRDSFRSMPIDTESKP